MDVGRITELATAGTALLGVIFQQLDKIRRGRIDKRAAEAKAKSELPDRLRENYEALLESERKQTEVAEHRRAKAYEELDESKAEYQKLIVVVDTLQHQIRKLSDEVTKAIIERDQLRRKVGNTDDQT